MTSKLYNMEIRHSVVMITYNQERLISEALDSLFSQSVLPYEVIISDDASFDNTWDVIQQYQKCYPNIIKAYRNKENMGIYPHINKLIPLPTGDIVSWLSGDDLYKPGIFEAFNKVVQQHDYLNPATDKFLIISNCINLYNDQREIVYDNTIFRQSDLFKVKLRYGLNFRETGISIALWRSLQPIPTDLGIFADWAFSMNQIENSEHFFFINDAYPIYRIGTGIVSRTKEKTMYASKLKVIEYLEQKYLKRIDQSDLKFLSFAKKECQYKLHKNFISCIACIWVGMKIMGDNTWNNFGQHTFFVFLKSVMVDMTKVLHVYDIIRKLKANKR